MSWLLFLFALSVMLVLHELGHYVVARLSGITVLEFGIGLPPRVFSVTRGNIIYSLNAIPLGAFVRMVGEEDPTTVGSFARQPACIRALVLLAGPGMNALLAVVVFAVAAMMGTPTAVSEGMVRIAHVLPDSPAALAGLQDDDRIVSFDGVSVTTASEVGQATRAHLDQPVTITVQRAEGIQQVTLQPRSNPPAGQGAIGIMLAPHVVLVQAGLWDAVGIGLEQTRDAMLSVVQLPQHLLDGSITPAEARPVGVVGMGQLTVDAVSVGTQTGMWTPLLTLIGLFSSGLALMNILPLPALDGSRLLLVIVEVIRGGRRLAPLTEMRMHYGGLLVFLALALLVNLNDLLNPVSLVGH